MLQKESPPAPNSLRSISSCRKGGICHVIMYRMKSVLCHCRRATAPPPTVRKLLLVPSPGGTTNEDEEQLSTSSQHKTKDQRNTSNNQSTTNRAGQQVTNKKRTHESGPQDKQGSSTKIDTCVQKHIHATQTKELSIPTETTREKLAHSPLQGNELGCIRSWLLSRNDTNYLRGFTNPNCF